LVQKRMKVIYDQAANTLTIILTENPIAESDQDKPGVILDYDDQGNLVSLEILDASRRVSIPSKIEYQFSPGAG
jgi:YD repeat-containing protein